jgi:anti-sigma factor RsiW
MNCEAARVLVNALVDGELDAGNAREVEGHVAICPPCAAALSNVRDLHGAMRGSDLRHKAPLRLSARIGAALPRPAPTPIKTDRRTLLKGFAFGATLSGAVAASGLLLLLRDDRERQIAGDLVSAHLRSLQAGRLTDVETSDQHVVKPWFNGKVDVAPPVVDLTAKGFTLLGGRLDYLEGKPSAVIVYKRRKHVINLFIETNAEAGDGAPSMKTAQGFNIRHWTEGGLDFWAISDINAEELTEFQKALSASLRPRAGA